MRRFAAQCFDLRAPKLRIVISTRRQKSGNINFRLRPRVFQEGATELISIISAGSPFICKYGRRKFSLMSKNREQDLPLCPNIVGENSHCCRRPTSRISLYVRRSSANIVGENSHCCRRPTSRISLYVRISSAKVLIAVEAP